MCSIHTTKGRVYENEVQGVLRHCSSTFILLLWGVIVLKVEMNEREQQISFVMSMIQELCENYEIGIIPYRHKDGTLMVLVEDAKTGKQYALVNNK